MKRFSFVLLAVSVAAMTACTGPQASSNGETGGTGATGATGAEATSAAVASERGHVTVNVSCPSPTGAAGLTVAPWKVHSPKAGQVTWKVTPEKDMDEIVAAPVGGKPWPFENSSYSLKIGGDTTAALADTAQPGVPYRYKLTAVCGADSMVIDPDVIVDPTATRDTTQKDQQ